MKSHFPGDEEKNIYSSAYLSTGNRIIILFYFFVIILIISIFIILCVIYYAAWSPKKIRLLSFGSSLKSCELAGQFQSCLTEVSVMQRSDKHPKNKLCREIERDFIKAFTEGNKDELKSF